MGLRVAQVLRDARDLMNTNGRHWLQGDMHVFIEEETLEYAEGDGLKISPKAQVGDTAFCAWGGIREVADDLEVQVEAMEALVQIINPSSWGAYLEYEQDMLDQYEAEIEYDPFVKDRFPTFDHYWNGMFDSREECLGDIIATWNDDEKRTWADVRTSLTAAAAKAKRRKENAT
jgi:hypothetical protein